MADASAVAALVAELRGSRKYATLDERALARTSAWALDRSPTRKEASKAARRKLHQVYGAYLPVAGLEEAQAAARTLGGEKRLGREELRNVCRAVLAAHTSTRERLEIMPEFFAAAFGPVCGSVRVADIGAGLNAFAIPWMPIADRADYLSIDVDDRMQQLAELLAPQLPIALVARTEDLVSSSEPVAADVALLLKIVPVLEQQRAGAASRLFARLDARRIVITISAHSLGRRKPGMRERLTSAVGRLIPQLREREISRYEFRSETMLVVSDTSG